MRKPLSCEGVLFLISACLSELGCISGEVEATRDRILSITGSPGTGQTLSRFSSPPLPPVLVAGMALLTADLASMHHAA